MRLADIKILLELVVLRAVAEVRRGRAGAGEGWGKAADHRVVVAREEDIGFRGRINAPRHRGGTDGDAHASGLEGREIIRIQQKLLSVNFVGTRHAPVDTVDTMHFRRPGVDIKTVALFYSIISLLLSCLIPLVAYYLPSQASLITIGAPFGKF